jgi:hypothetical protein
MYCRYLSIYLSIYVRIYVCMHSHTITGWALAFAIRYAWSNYCHIHTHTYACVYVCMYSHSQGGLWRVLSVTRGQIIVAGSEALEFEATVRACMLLYRWQALSTAPCATTVSWCCVIFATIFIIEDVQGDRQRT